ncbi:MAG: SEC-C domain-containing protein [Rhizobium sp.]|nr:SEC-C domain-containing protein [Rhizobium sp.]
MVSLGEDFTAHVDVAMAVRRQGVSGNPEVEGVLTRYRKTLVGALLEQIQEATIPELTELGLWILQLSGQTGDGLSRALESQVRLAVREHATKDLSFPFEDQSAGLTIHLSALPDEIAQEKILQHCRLKKYDLKAERWYGLLIRPDDFRIRHALVLNEPWKQNYAMDKVVAEMPRRAPLRLEAVGRPSKKVGRNELCPCGSGLKYKKCCLLQ